MDVSLGSMCQSVQQCVAVNLQARSAMLMSEIEQRAVVTPSMDQLLRSGLSALKDNRAYTM